MDSPTDPKLDEFIQSILPKNDTDVAVSDEKSFKTVPPKASMVLLGLVAVAVVFILYVVRPSNATQSQGAALTSPPQLSPQTQSVAGAQTELPPRPASDSADKKLSGTPTPTPTKGATPTPTVEPTATPTPTPTPKPNNNESPTNTPTPTATPTPTTPTDTPTPSPTETP